MIAEAISYLILIGGLLGICLGIFGLLRPRLRRISSVLPSVQRHDRDLRTMEDALAEIDFDEVDREAETFRSFFGRQETSARKTAPPASPESKPPVRTFKAPAAADEGLPRVALLMPPLNSTSPVDGEEAVPAEEEEDDGPAVESVLEEEADLSVVEDDNNDGLLDDAGLDEDLLSLFAETGEVHTVPEVVRDAVPRVTADELLTELRQVRELIGSITYESDEPAA